jgi:O-acetyl-ADP-ribose deacetylase (regulator of RNase III)
MIEVITGDLFEAPEQYICHQCNCVTNRAAHLAKDVFERFPYADIYSGRVSPDAPGTVIIKGNGQDQRYVAALLGQYYPGFPKYPDSALDGPKVREKYFHRALIHLAKTPGLQSIAFPWKIACGAAGGNWEHYLGTLENFAKYVEATQGTKVVIYRREGDV